MSDLKPYKPIDCAHHDGYELACMRRAIHAFRWHEQDQILSETLRCLDLEYKDDEEFLLAENRAGKAYRIRLDQIISSLPY